MTAELPAPLVPAEVDLRDFAFMPLDVQRLRDSDLASDETPESCWAAVLLWCASWHQVPAASIPDSDQWQAKQAGYVSRGRVDAQWPKVREGALRGWVACSDGRLYHPVVAEKARDAWRSKLIQRHKTECARIKKHNQRHEINLPLPDLEAWIEAGCPAGHALYVPEDKREVSQGQARSVHRETLSKGQGEGQGQGQGLIDIPPSEVAAPAAGAGPPTTPPDFDGRNAEALNGKAVVPISASWELPEQWGIDAESLGWKPGEVLREAEKFRQYWTAGKGSGTRRAVKGWRQTWSNWLEKAAKDRR